MRAFLLALAVLVTSAAATACTQGNTQLPPFYDGGSASSVDSSTGDASDDVTITGGDGATEATTDAPAGDAHVEASVEEGGGAEGGPEAGPSDAGDAGG